MRALILTSGGLISARVLNTWILSGNSTAAIWIGALDQHHFLRRDRALGIAAPLWSTTAAVRRFGIRVENNPKLSEWKDAHEAIRRLEVDVLITCLTYEIVPEGILGRFPGRAVNIHPALLPNYRGPNPRRGMILDQKADQYGGVTVHRLTPEIDRGDIIGTRAVPFDPDLGFINWNVRQAHAAGELVVKELQAYFKSRLTPRSQPSGSGSYRKVESSELAVSASQSANRIEWLCRHFGSSGWLFFQPEKNGNSAKRYIVHRFIHKVGPRTSAPYRIGWFAIEFDATDARVRSRPAGMVGAAVPYSAVPSRHRLG